MSAPSLSEQAYEVLRALVLGLELRETSGGWVFPGGHWQESLRSHVPPEVISELVVAGFVQHGDGSRAELTDAGIKACHLRTQETLETALKWVNLPNPVASDFMSRYGF